MKKPSKFKRKLAFAMRSATAWYLASIPTLLAIAEAFKDNLPSLDPYLSGWQKVALACVASGIGVALRVRKTGKDE